jgi:hypothetical protein
MLFNKHFFSVDTEQVARVREFGNHSDMDHYNLDLNIAGLGHKHQKLLGFVVAKSLPTIPTRAI